MSLVTTATGHVIMHPVVSKSLKIWATTLGRDKTYRAIQYFARFYAYILLTRGHQEQAQRWAALKNHLGLARKLMRLGKPLEHLQAALKASQSSALSRQSAERFTTIARQLSYAGYLALDAVVWANSVKFINLVPTKADKVLRASLRFWFAGILFGLGNSLLKAGRLANESKALKAVGTSEKSVGDGAVNYTQIKAVEKERAAVRFQMLLDLMDVWIPATGLGIVNFNDGVVGMLGFVTSVMAFRSQWNSIQMG